MAWALEKKTIIIKSVTPGVVDVKQNIDNNSGVVKVEQNITITAKGSGVAIIQGYVGI